MFFIFLMSQTGAFEVFHVPDYSKLGQILAATAKAKQSSDLTTLEKFSYGKTLLPVHLFVFLYVLSVYIPIYLFFSICTLAFISLFLSLPPSNSLTLFSFTSLTFFPHHCLFKKTFSVDFYAMKKKQPSKQG